jgi:hypothetical protein
MTQFMELHNQWRQKMHEASSFDEYDYCESTFTFLNMPSQDPYYRNPKNLLTAMATWFYEGEEVSTTIKGAIYNWIFEMKPTLKLRRWDVMKNMIKYDPSNRDTMMQLKADFDSRC